MPAAVQTWQEPEGPSREERLRAKLERAMQMKIAADAARDRAAAEKSMRAALQGREELTMGDDDLAHDEGDGEPVDWRAKMSTGTGLTEKQMKLAEAIRSKEYKVQVWCGRVYVCYSLSCSATRCVACGGCVACSL